MKRPAESSFFCAYGEAFSISTAFLVGSCFLFGNVFEPKVSGKSPRQRTNMRSLKRVLTAQVMSQNDVRQFVREHHGQTALIGEHVDQPAAYYDRVYPTLKVSSGEVVSTRRSGLARGQFDVYW